jgi:hypothetical protein
LEQVRGHFLRPRMVAGLDPIHYVLCVFHLSILNRRSLAPCLAHEIYYRELAIGAQAFSCIYMEFSSGMLF